MCPAHSLYCRAFSTPAKKTRHSGPCQQIECQSDPFPQTMAPGPAIPWTSAHFLSILLVIWFRLVFINSRNTCSSSTRVVAVVSGNGSPGAELDTGLEVYAAFAAGAAVNGSVNTVRRGQTGGFGNWVTAGLLTFCPADFREMWPELSSHSVSAEKKIYKLLPMGKWCRHSSIYFQHNIVIIHYILSSKEKDFRWYIMKSSPKIML